MRRQTYSMRDEVLGELTIVYRRIVRQMPDDDGDAECYWYVEARSGCLQYPMGTAYLKQMDNGRQLLLKYILVADPFRKQGIGRQLIAACFHRWPNFDFGSAVSKSGRALLKSIRREAPRLSDNVELYSTAKDSSTAGRNDHPPKLRRHSK